jgi:hypothetical protein
MCILPFSKKSTYKRLILLVTAFLVDKAVLLYVASYHFYRGCPVRGYNSEIPTPPPPGGLEERKMYADEILCADLSPAEYLTAPF